MAQDRLTEIIDHIGQAAHDAEMLYRRDLAARRAMAALETYEHADRLVRSAQARQAASQAPARPGLRLVEVQPC